MGILTGKVAIITGATRGIVKAEAAALGKEGAAVAVVANEDATSSVADLAALGITASGHYCDVSKADQVKRTVEAVVSEFGQIDILVNNAHYIPKPHPIETWTVEEMNQQWETGPLGTWLFMKTCFPVLRKPGGRIINTVSSAGIGYYFGYSGYAAAKEAIRSLTRQAAREWGVTGDTISPNGGAGMIV